MLHPFVVVGPEPGQNFWVDEQGNWRPERYCPAYVRRYPFLTIRATDRGQAKTVICIDEAGLADTPPHLFDARGEPTAYWRDLQRLIEAFDTAQTHTQIFCARLDSLEPHREFRRRHQPHAGQTCLNHRHVSRQGRRFAGARARPPRGASARRKLAANLCTFDIAR